MKKIIFVIFAIFCGSAFATCPSGHLESGDYIWMSNNEPCPHGYVETHDCIWVNPGTPCPTNYIEQSDYIPIRLIDQTRGTGGTAFMCIAS